MKKIYSSILVLAFVLVANASFAAVDIFMKVLDQNGQQIKGESLNQSFQDWIELLSVGELSENALTTGGAGGTGAGKAVLDPIKFQMRFNNASLPLLEAVYRGTAMRSVDIWFTKPNVGGGGGSSPCNCAFYKIHMEDVFITFSRNGSDDESINQELHFKPSKIAWAYYKQSNTGTYPSTPSQRFGWDITRNIVYSYNF